jgi:hypothetical protein
VAADRQPHALEHVLDPRFRHLQLAQQLLGVETVGAIAVARQVARRGGVGEQRPRRRVELRQAFLLELHAGERILAAGVEDDDVHRVGGLGDAVDHRVDVDASRIDVLDPRDLRVGRQEIVAPGELHAVAGEIEHADRLRPGERLGVGVDRLQHFLARQVEAGRDLEAAAPQLLADGFGVVGRVLERPEAVAAVADDQRAARRHEQRHACRDAGCVLAFAGGQVAVGRLRPRRAPAGERQARSGLYQAAAFPVGHSFSPARILKRSGLSASTSFPSSGNGSPSSCDAINSAASAAQTRPREP